MKIINKLPHWVITNERPAFYDTDSGTAIEQTALLYKKMSELVEHYNLFVDEVNTQIDSVVNENNKDLKEFEENIIKITHDYIKMIDEKMKVQDVEISSAIDFMKNNIKSSVTEVIESMKNSGELDEAILNAIDNIGDRVNVLEKTEYKLVYENGSEHLILQKTVKEGE